MTHQGKIYSSDCPVEANNSHTYGGEITHIPLHMVIRKSTMATDSILAVGIANRLVKRRGALNVPTNPLNLSSYCKEHFVFYLMIKLNTVIYAYLFTSCLKGVWPCMTCIPKTSQKR